MFLKELFAKLGLDSHHKMERFGVLFLILFLGLGVTTGLAFKKYLSLQNQKLGNNAIYTDSFTSSVAGVNGTVKGVYVNQAKTRTLLLVKFDDTDEISLNAEDYQVYVSAKGQKRQCKPKGGVYCFGATGYLGIYLSDVSGFPTQVLDVVVRNNVTLSDREEGYVDETTMDESFAKHDQFRIYFNPGASGATHLEALDSEQLSISEIYKQSVGDFEEDAIRDELKDSLKAMQKALAKRDEYGRRLTANGMILPEEPLYMKGDKIEESKDGSLSLVTQNVFPGGYDFDWQSKRISEGGYLKTLKERESGETDEALFVRMANVANTTDVSLGTQLSTLWFRQDGSEFDKNLSDLLPTDETVSATIDDYETAQREYLSVKQNYEQTQLKELLYLEYLSEEQDAQFSVNTEDSALVLWDQK